MLFDVYGCCNLILGLFYSCLYFSLWNVRLCLNLKHSLTDPVAMWHVRAEIAPAILLVVDFGGWYKIDSKTSGGNSSHMVQHTQVSLLKDVIVPYTHMLPTLHLSDDKHRHTLLYFKGAKHRHRVSFMSLIQPMP